MKNDRAASSRSSCIARAALHASPRNDRCRRSFILFFGGGLLLLLSSALFSQPSDDLISVHLIPEEACERVELLA